MRKTVDEADSGSACLEEVNESQSIHHTVRTEFPLHILMLLTLVEHLLSIYLADAEGRLRQP